MTWKSFRELMEVNKVPDDAILRATDPDNGGTVDVTGVVYGPDKDQGYTVEFQTDSDDGCSFCGGDLQTRVIGGERYQCCPKDGCPEQGTPV